MINGKCLLPVVHTKPHARRVAADVSQAIPGGRETPSSAAARRAAATVRFHPMVATLSKCKVSAKKESVMKAIICLSALLGLFITTGCEEHEHHHEGNWGGAYEDHGYYDHGHGDYRDHDFHEQGYNDYYEHR